MLMAHDVNVMIGITCRYVLFLNDMVMMVMMLFRFYLLSILSMLFVIHVRNSLMGLSA